MMATRALSAHNTWLGSAALVLAAHGAVLAALLLAGVRLPLMPPEEPVVLIELPPLAAPARRVQQVQAETQPQPVPVQPQTFAPRVPAPQINTPLPREVVAVQPPQPQASRNPALPQSSAAAQVAPLLASTSDAAGDAAQAERQEADYGALVLSYVRRGGFSPTRSRRAGISGTPYVAFTVNRRAEISGVTLSRSSGHDVLDQEALEYVRRLTSVPEFPRDLRRPQVTLIVSLRFTSQR